jgi:hypothetical protein
MKTLHTLLATIVVAPVLVTSSAAAQTESSTPPIVLVLPAVAAPGSCATPSQSAPIAIEELEATDAPRPLVPRPLRLGISGLAGTVPRGNGIEATWTAGLDVGVRLTALEDRWLFLDLSLRRMTFAAAGSLAGEVWAIGGSPTVSIGGRLLEFVEIYLELGVGLDAGSRGLGAAPVLGGGARVYVTDFFSVAIEGAAHVAATSTFLLGTQVFPQSAAIFQGGLALAFHVG